MHLAVPVHPEAERRMKARLCLLIAVTACAFGTAQAQIAETEHGIPDAPTLLTNSATASTGSMLTKELKWKSNIPLNKTYGELTPEQRAEFRALYVSLAEDDEPPFPIQGLKPVFSALRRGHDVLQARGELNLAVTVGPDGKAVSVEDFGGVKGVNASTMTHYAQSVFMMAKYKPGMCKGTPCTMQFPFKIKLN